MLTYKRRSKQPKYAELEIKINARAEIIKLYKEYTGRDSIEREYWTLCNEQPDIPGSEINQFLDAGFLNKSQFHGVDESEEIITRNRNIHPTANWYAGDWLKIINKVSFKPSVVYFDSTGFVISKKTINYVVSTMYACPANCLLLVNALMNDTRSKRRFDDNQFIEDLGRRINSFQKKLWDNKGIPNYIYNATGKSNMITFVFYKIKSNQEGKVISDIK